MQGRGCRVHRDTAPIIRCKRWYVWTNTHIKHHVRTTTTTPLSHPPSPHYTPTTTTHSAPKSAGPRRTKPSQGQNTVKAGSRAAGRDAVTDGYVAAPVPLLVVAALAGGDNVDATTVSYLLSIALAKKEVEKEEGEAKFEEKMLEINRRVRNGAATPAQEAAWRGWASRPAPPRPLLGRGEKEEEEEEENQVPVWVLGQLLLMTPHRLSLHSGFRVGVSVLPEEDRFWILVLLDSTADT